MFLYDYFSFLRHYILQIDENDTNASNANTKNGKQEKDAELENKKKKMNGNLTFEN